jgi:hypothetical protein
MPGLGMQDWTQSPGLETTRQTRSQVYEGQIARSRIVVERTTSSHTPDLESPQIVDVPVGPEERQYTDARERREVPHLTATVKYFLATAPSNRALENIFESRA